MLYDPKWETPPVEVKEEEWRIILRRAADLLEQRGWIQGKLKDSHGRMCALGAINAAQGKSTYYAQEQPAGKALVRHIQLTSRNGIPSWNDTPGRTKEEVIETMREVANS